MELGGLLFKACILLFLTCLVSLQSILTTQSKVNGKYEYFPDVLVFCSECIKLCVASTLLWRDTEPPQRSERLMAAFKTLWPSSAAPAVIYAIQNNLQYLALLELATPAYQVLTNMKVVMTGVCFSVFLKKKLSPAQWAALVLVTAGSATSQLPDCAKLGSDGTVTYAFVGIIYVLLICLCSGAAAVASEYLVKSADINFSNIQLYKWSIVVDAVIVVLKRGMLVASPSLLFQGFNMWAVLVLLTNALLGLVVSLVLKYADSVMKAYSASCAMLLTTVVSWLLFDYSPTIQLFLGITVVSTAIYLHTISPPSPPPQTKPDIVLEVREGPDADA